MVQEIYRNGRIVHRSGLQHEQGCLAGARVVNRTDAEELVFEDVYCLRRSKGAVLFEDE